MSKRTKQPTAGIQCAAATDAQSGTESVLAWHFVRSDGRLRDGQVAKDGQTYRLSDGEQPVLCQRGYHASRRPLDALRYAPGWLICRVRLSGTIVEETGDDKLVASERTVLAMADASRILREFACDCAERALHMVEERTGRKPDPRSVRAIEVARRHIRGEATGQELREARSAADTADADADTAAAAYAAYAAADAADAAAAAYAAYAAKARYSEREWQNGELERRLLALLSLEEEETTA